MRVAVCLHHGNHDAQKYRKCMCTGTMKLWVLELGKQNMAATLYHCRHYRTFNRGGEGTMDGAVGAMEAGAASHLVDQRAQGTASKTHPQWTSARPASCPRNSTISPN